MQRENPEQLQKYRESIKNFPKFHNGIIGSEIGYDFSEILNIYSGRHLMGEIYSEFISKVKDRNTIILGNEVIDHTFLVHVYQRTHNNINMTAKI